MAHVYALTDRMGIVGNCHHWVSDTSDEEIAALVSGSIIITLSESGPRMEVFVSPFKR